MGRMSKLIDNKMRTVRQHEVDGRCYTTSADKCTECTWWAAQCEAASKKEYRGPAPPKNSVQSQLKKAARIARQEAKKDPYNSPAAVAFRAALDRYKPK